MAHSVIFTKNGPSSGGIGQPFATDKIMTKVHDQGS
jgi:hypothetical protein